ncbi:MAG: efflux RND transporter periplasmic adaptor subunit [Bacteroidota bacterium]
MKKIFLIAIAGLLVTSCSSDKKTKLEKLKAKHDDIAEQIKSLEKEIALEEDAGIDKIAEVLVTELKTGEFNHYLEVQGKIDGEENVTVSPKMMGVVTAINVKEGQSVTKGQALAQLDYAVLKQTLVTLDSSLVFATNLYNKQKNLWDQKIGSEVQYLTAKNNKEYYENLIKSTQEQIKLASIVSPINGTIEEIPIKVGQTVTPGVTTAFRVVNLTKVKVVAEIAEAYSAKLKTGNEVIVTFPDLDKEINSKISFASKFINAINRTFTCEVELKETDESYRANMIAVLKIKDYSADTAISVPVNVIQIMDEESYVYIAVQDSGKFVAKKVKVEPGQTYNGYTEILKGLKEGDKLVTFGYQNIEDGQTLNF